MVPSAYVTLDAMPLTPNRKTDRKALPAPDRKRDDRVAPYVPPDSDLERLIAGVWQDLLQIDRMSTDDNFFDVGANSLLMVRAQIRLSESLQRPVSLVELFRYPSVGALARFLAEKDTGTSSAMADSESRASSRRDALERRKAGRERRPPEPRPEPAAQ
jgi:hypothetical protein